MPDRNATANFPLSPCGRAWWCITPYVGGGVGFASLSITGYKDVNVPNLSVAYGQNNTETNFAWAVYAGLSYKVNPSLTLDLSYRYTDLGDIRTGRIATFDNASTSGGFQIEDITSNDLMLSVRLALGSQPRQCRSPSNRSPSTIRR